MTFIVVIGLLLGMLLGVGIHDRFSGLPEIDGLTKPKPDTARAGSEVQTAAFLDRLISLAQSTADMQLLYQSQILRLQQLESRVQQLESAQQASLTEPVDLVSVVEDGSPDFSSVLDGEGTGTELTSLPDTSLGASERVEGWFVHVGSRATQRAAEALALALTESLGLNSTVIPGSEGAYLVRICRLATQVKAQETVQLLRRSSDNEALWIGRGCQPNLGVERH